MDRRHERQARNEALIREVNERIEDVDRAAEEGRVDPGETVFEFLCECGVGGDGDVGCEEYVRMTIREYEVVRAQDDRFVLSPGHEEDALESVVIRTERYVVVDKRREAERFVADDPRGAPSE